MLSDFEQLVSTQEQIGNLHSDTWEMTALHIQMAAHNKITYLAICNLSFS